MRRQQGGQRKSGLRQYWRFLSESCHAGALLQPCSGPHMRLPRCGGRVSQTGWQAVATAGGRTEDGRCFNAVLPQGPRTPVRSNGTTCWSIIRRSEEHTSELQSQMRISYAVFCLTKKQKLVRTNTIATHTTSHNH